MASNPLRIVKQSETPAAKRWVIRSLSDGRRHYVLVKRKHAKRKADMYTCSCPGWIFHGHCKHITAMKQAEKFLGE